MGGEGDQNHSGVYWRENWARPIGDSRQGIRGERTFSEEKKDSAASLKKRCKNQVLRGTRGLDQGLTLTR